MQSLNSTQISKINSYIGFSIKSGKYLFGLELLKKSKKKPFIVFYDECIGKNSFKQLITYSEQNNVKVFELPNNHLNDLLKRKNIKILSLYDENLCKAIIDIID